MSLSFLVAIKTIGEVLKTLNNVACLLYEEVRQCFYLSPQYQKELAEAGKRVDLPNVTAGAAMASTCMCYSQSWRNKCSCVCVRPHARSSIWPFTVTKGRPPMLNTRYRHRQPVLYGCRTRFCFPELAVFITFKICNSWLFFIIWAKNDATQKKL